MEMSGEHKIKASKQEVWNNLNDPEVLKEAIPGCESIEKTSENELIATVKAKVGPVSAKFNGKVTLSNINPPSSYTISGEGQGGPAGFGKGSANVSLEEEDENTTILRFSATAQVGGKLAQIGTRLVDGAAKKIAGQFFENFAKILESDNTAEKEDILPNDKEADTSNKRNNLKISPFMWVSGLIIVILALILVFN
ncbi:MAG: carbon monoxide dehydrogenase [Rhodospirillaceae bacterium]|nr:carbon monoxide dehydrogenase [Rhodospirillaceae bacterium]|tara:strand:+ start:145 stop:732 length:588 start_codon:yes stop_codon:yes gene_type:complete